MRPSDTNASCTPATAAQRQYGGATVPPVDAERRSMSSAVHSGGSTGQRVAVALLAICRGVAARSVAGLAGWLAGWWTVAGGLWLDSLAGGRWLWAFCCLLAGCLDLLFHYMNESLPAWLARWLAGWLERPEVQDQRFEARGRAIDHPRQDIGLYR